MKVVPCLELCPDCPLRNGQDITRMAEIGYSVPAQLNEERNVASFELRNGTPVNFSERTSSIGFAAEDGKIVSTARVKGADFDSGQLSQAFSDCSEPTPERTGFLKLRSKLACTALNKLGK